MEYRDLEITLLSAMDLNRVNLITKMDVYAVVSIYGDNNNNQRIKTPVDHQGDANPNWNFTIKFKIDDAALQMNRLFLDIKFICERTLGDKDVGQVNIPIKELLDSQPKSAKQIVRYQVIKPNGKPKGQIAFIYEFSPKIASASELEPVAAYPFGSISGYPQPGAYPPYSVESGSGHFPPYPAVAGSYPPQAPYPKADGNGNYPPPSSYPKTDGIGGYPKTDENVSYPPPSSYLKTDGIGGYPKTNANVSYPPPSSYPKTDGNGSYPPLYSYAKTDGNGSYAPPSSYPKTDGSGSYPASLSYANPYPKADGSGSYPPVSVSPYPKTDGNGGFTYAGGYPQPHPAGYGYPPPGYPPQAGHGYPQQAAAAAPKKNKFGGLGLGTGLLGGAIGGLLVGDMISDAADFDSGGFDF